MKALQIVAKREVAMVDVPEPQLEAPNQVKVKMKANCICNLHEWKSYTDNYHQHFKCEYPLDVGYPGHEAAGEVVAVGADVTNVVVGDKVFLTSHAGMLHKEYTVCDAEWAFRLKPAIDYADAAALEMIACHVGLFDTAEKLGDCRVVLIGMGPAGLAGVHTLRAYMPREIIAIDLVDSRLEQALTMGADRVVNAKDEAGIKALESSPPETAMDCSGSQEGMKMALNLAVNEALIFGYNDKPLEVMQSDWFWKRLVIRTGNIIWQSTARKAAALLNRGVIQPSLLVTHRVPFSTEGYTEAMRLVEAKECGKVLMEF